MTYISKPPTEQMRIRQREINRKKIALKIFTSKLKGGFAMTVEESFRLADKFI